MQSNLAVCGLDIGSWTFKICVHDGQKFEVLTNQANFRQTPSLVAYTDMERVIGETAQIKIKNNYANTIRAPMRLIGLQKNYNQAEEQLRHSPVKYELKDQLIFFVDYQSEKIRVKPQQVLLALISNAKKILESHHLSVLALYITIPSYMSNNERKTIIKCVQTAAICSQIYLIDDWICLAAQFSYSRTKQLMNTPDHRNVVFIDFGYSKLSVFAVQFTNTAARLVDYDHLKFTGSKNIDRLLAEFYNDEFKKITKTDISLLNTPKALVKLNENIQKQRKILSANNQFQLSIECLYEQHDLHYNLNRQHFENISMPVLSDLAALLQNFKRRIEPLVKISAVQLVGGTSRIPFVQSIIANIFQMEPSKTLNSSQALVRGAVICGALEQKFVEDNGYRIEEINLKTVSLGYQTVKGDYFFGENEKMYPQRKVIFPMGTKLSSEQTVLFSEQGLTECYLFYENNIVATPIAYMRFQTPNKMIVSLDHNQIIHVQLGKGTFDIYKTQQKSQSKWKQISKLEKQMHANHQRITNIYNRKNEYESMVYSTRSKLNDQFANLVTIDELKNLSVLLDSNQKWLEQQNERKLGTVNDLEQFNQKIDELSTILKIFESRRKKKESISSKFNKFESQIARALANASTIRKKDKIFELKETIFNAYRQMQRANWDGQLTESDLDKAKKDIITILMQQ